DGTQRSVPGGPYSFTPIAGGAVPVQMQVTTAGWSVTCVDREARTWRAGPKPLVPSLLLRAFPGVPATTGADSTVSRKVTVRWLRDREAELRPDFGGYRIY